MSIDPGSALSALEQSHRAYTRQLSEAVPLSFATACICPAFPALHDGNHLTDVTAPSAAAWDDAWAEAEAFYAERGLTCYRWEPARTEPLEPFRAFLAPKGFTEAGVLGMVWTDRQEVARREDVQVVQARAMRPALRELRMSDTTYDDSTRELLARTEAERINDPSYDCFLAMRDGQPVGKAALLQVGDIGRVEHVFVRASARRQGVGRTLMSYVLRLARQLAMRIVVLETHPEDSAAQALYEECGFERAGTWVRFHSPQAGLTS